MLDIKFIRKNPDKVKKACRDKGVRVDIDKLLKIDKERMEALKSLEEARAKKNKGSREISRTRDKNEKEKIISEMKKIDRESDRLNGRIKELDEGFNLLMLQVPNLPFDEVPRGRDEKGNVVLRQVGEKPHFDFKPRDHLEIGEMLDIIDVKRAAKVAGSRFTYLKGEAVLLEIALIRFAFDLLTKEGFVPVLPPVMLRPEMARGTGYFETTDLDEAYFLPKDNLFLTGTAEQSLLTMHAGEVFKEKELPRRYLGFSTCFRREAGSYGKDTRGILRVHQFDKAEMFSFVGADDSQKELNFFLEMEERIMRLLKIPYQVIDICTGDLGRPAAAKYDIEAWIPSQNRYRETHSTSNCTDFQSRRLNIRYRNKKNELEFTHTVNGTAIAMGRMIIAIIENYQQKDGSVKMPEALRQYLPFREIKPKESK